MRVQSERKDINSSSILSFFNRRAQYYDEANPYSVTMYQDDNPELVHKRNEREIARLLPYLCVNNHSSVLDVACGIGRWADALCGVVKRYVGIDFSEGLIRLARSRCDEPNATFLVGSATDLNLVLKKSEIFNRILIVGLLMYLNDEDVRVVFDAVERRCEQHAIICIREPIGIKERLTLVDHYSDELKDQYNAIYRTRNEIVHLAESSLLNRGFTIGVEGYLFDDTELNNRKETSQYFIILNR